MELFDEASKRTRRLPFVSIVIPLLNGERTIRDCLVSLLRTDYPADRREILVVDNGSTDQTAEIVKSFPVRYLREERPGPSAARNRGIKASKGEILAFTDQDCLVSTGWLHELVQAFNDKAVGGVAGEVVAYPPRTAPEWYASRTRHLSPQKYLGRSRLPFAVFANLAFRRDVFDRIGLLDKTFFQGESTEFCTRFFRGTSWKLQYVPKALVFHCHRTTVREFFNQQWNYGRGNALLYIKYRQEIPWSWRQSVRVYRDLAGAAWSLVKSGVRYSINGDRENLYFCYFEFLRKLAGRLGFLRQSLSQGYLYF